MFMVGADPELFVKKNSVPFAATGLIPGNKEEPLPVKDGAVQVDGLALEFNINPIPFGNTPSFNLAIVRVMTQLRDMVKKADPALTFAKDSWVDFPEEYYASLPDDAKVLGCNPDFNAYRGGEENPAPDGETNRRGAAGHLHVGWGQDIPVDNPEHIENCCRIIKYLDRTVGLASIIINDDATRREHYGAAGAFRPKPYGVEYRVPDNAWLWSKVRRNFISDTLNYALRVIGSESFDNYEKSAQGAISDADVAHIINTSGNSKEALRVFPALVYHSVYIPRELQSISKETSNG